MPAGSAVSAARATPLAELLRRIRPAHTLGQESQRELVQAHALGLGQLRKLPVHRPGQPQYEFAAVVSVLLGVRRGNRVFGRTLLDRDAHGIADLIERADFGGAIGKIGRAEHITAVFFHEEREAIRAVRPERATPVHSTATAPPATRPIFGRVLGLSGFDRFVDQFGFIYVVDVWFH
jgi:hypothetical protein